MSLISTHFLLYPNLYKTVTILIFTLYVSSIYTGGIFEHPIISVYNAVYKQMYSSLVVLLYILLLLEERCFSCRQSLN